MSKVIWHVGGLTNFNHGDGALQSATERIVSDRYDGNIKFVHIDTQKTFFSEQLIKQMNDDADLVLIGGGGFIFHRPSDLSYSGWQFNIRTEDIDKIKIPLFAYGIGNNKFPHDKDLFTERMWENIQAVIDKSVAFSVRNDGTKRSMKEAGLRVEKVEVVPDAVVFAESYPFDHTCLNNDKLKIGLNFATDRWTTRFTDEDKARETLDAVLEVCKEKAQEYNAKIYLIEHLYDNDMNKVSKPLIRSRAKTILGGDGCIIFDETRDELYPSFGYLSKMFVDIYRQMDIMIGMRGHANIIPFGQNVPCIGIGEHNKVRWFLEEVDLLDLYVPFDSNKSLNKDELSETIDRVVKNISKYKTNMATKMEDLSIVKNRFVDKISESLYGLSYRSCPICQGDLGFDLPQYTREFPSSGPQVSTCDKCRTVCLNPVMTDIEYNKFYNNDGQKQFTDTIREVREENYDDKLSVSDQRRADIVNKITGAYDRVLDVGTGNSNFVKLVKNATGLDINKGRVDRSVARGLDVRHCDLYDWDEKVDVVTLFHVLEHITDPVKLIAKVSEILNERGTLVVEVPNLDDVLVSLPKYSNFYYQNAHCTYFTTDTLKKLMRLCNFEVVSEIRLQRYSLDNHLHWLFTGKPGKFNGIGILNSIYSWILRTLNKHDTVFLICKKEK